MDIAIYLYVVHVLKLTFVLKRLLNQLWNWINFKYLSIIFYVLNFMAKFHHIFVHVTAEFIHILLSVTHSFVNSTTQSTNFWS